MREEAFPVVSPRLLKDKSRPLAKPADLAEVLRCLEHHLGTART